MVFINEIDVLHEILCVLLLLVCLLILEIVCSKHKAGAKRLESEHESGPSHFFAKMMI